MPAPYSDNLYSDDIYSADEQDADALSPSDGYFHASSDEALPLTGPSDTPTSSNVPHVPNVLVEDPTLNAGAKAREAEEERLNSEAQTPRSPVQSPISPIHHRRSVEEDPVEVEPVVSPVQSTVSRVEPSSRVQSEAPPAYSPPTSPIRGYHTFAPTPLTSAMGVPDESARLLPREPESMGGSPDRPGLSVWRRTWDSFTLSNFRRKLKTLLGGLVILSIVIILLSTFTVRPHLDPDRNEENEDNGDGDSGPVKKPSSPLEPHDGLKWNPLQGCLNTPRPVESLVQGLSLHHDRNLTVIQTTMEEDGSHDGWNPRVFGEMILTPTSAESPGKLHLELITNDDALSVKFQFNKPEQRLVVLAPRPIKWPHSNGQPCIQIRATVYVPLDSTIEHLDIEAVHLDVLTKEGLRIDARNGAVLSSIIGDIVAPFHDGEDLPYQLAARDIAVNTVSGDIKGWYPLYDSLKLSTASGDITVDVGPKPAHPKLVKPALLDVRTLSGTVQLTEPIDAARKADRPDKTFPPRDYVALLNSASGDVTADLAFTSSAQAETASGDFKLRLWPVLDSNDVLNKGREGKLETKTRSGDTEVEVLEPLWTSSASEVPRTPSIPPIPEIPEIPNVPEVPSIPDKPIRSDPENPHWEPISDKDPYIIIDPWAPPAATSEDTTSSSGNPALSNLQSNHATISGEITLRYPASWEGRVSAETVSGSQKVRGEGLTVRKGGGSFPRKIRGTKGKGSSHIEAKSISGDQDILVGKA